MPSKIGTLSGAWELFAGSVKELAGAWVPLAQTALLYRAIAFLALTPLVGLLLRLLVERTGSAAVADVDIALFFFTTRAGAAALLLVGALIVALSALELACLMTSASVAGPASALA